MNEMNLVFGPELDPLRHKIVKHLIDGWVDNIDKFNVNIDKNDEMFLAPLSSYKQTHPAASEKKRRELAILRYFNVGIEILDIVKQLVAWKFNGFENIDAFLDFASGYGRFTRLLVQQMSPNRIWASDIYADAISFQKAQFGVNGVVSVTDPSEFVIETTFDCILVVSLFSHLPEKTFNQWLKKLYGLLRPGGMLMFSVIDESIKKPDVKMNEKGFGYVRRSESRTLDSNDYGGAFVTEGFVSEAISMVTKGKGRFVRLPRGICNHQDLYVLVNDDSDFGSLNVNLARPTAHFGVCNVKNNQLHLGGWAGSRSPDAWIKDIQIRINGQLVQRCMPFAERPDVAKRLNNDQFINSGWNCLCPIGNKTSNFSTDILMIKVISSDDTEKNLFIGTIEEALSEKRIKRSI